MLKARADLIFDLPHEAWFDVNFMQKDIALALETARELGVEVPSATAAENILEFALGLGYGGPRHRCAVRGARSIVRRPSSVSDVTQVAGAAVRAIT
jgi:3-hydroxyisobutyrate dehydrogenase-like beta-hydroxyacid dehydrogenase